MKLISIIFLVLLSFSFFNLYPQSKNVSSPSVTSAITYTKINVSKISTYFYNNGETDEAPSGTGGFEFPRGGGVIAFFESGFLWGGIVDSQVRVGGSSFRSGLQPGSILSSGTAENSDLPHVRIFRVRSDFKTSSLAEEKGNELLDYNTIYTQYEKDWNEWPASSGAPFTDIDKNGIYNPDTDIPGIAGAVQTIWYVANDLKETNTIFLYGSSPIGIELQVTVWVYYSQPNVIFKKYKIINRVNQIDSMYVSIWADPDVGNPVDDNVGCDTLLNLAFAYNSSNKDSQYGNNVPAIGFGLLQGPMVPGTAFDKASYNGKLIPRKKNLPMTSFYYNVCCTDDRLTQPDQGEYGGTLDIYNYFRGNYNTGLPFKTPGGQITKYLVPGDPVSNKGWIDGGLRSDKQLGFSSGPFSMAIGDTQEVIFAQLASKTSTKENSNIDNIKYLRTMQTDLKNFFKNNLITDVSGEDVAAGPSDFSISQNYPNPFNPATNISFSVPRQVKVLLHVYDLLGNEVATLVNEEKSAGNYDVTFNAGGLTSGVYFYKIQAGDFSAVKKLILIK